MKTKDITSKLSCIECGSQNLRFNYRLNFGDVVSCRDCKLAFVRFDDINYFHQANSRWTDLEKIKYQIYSLPKLRKIALDRLKILMKYSKGNKIVEFGPNTGDFLYWANKKGFKVTGVDKHPAILNINKFNNLSVIKSDATDFSSGERYDVAVAFHLLEHLEAPGRLIKKIKQHLNPGGLLFLEVPNYDSFSRKTLGKHWYMFHDYHIIHFNKHSLTKMLTKNGFKVLLCQTIQPLSLYTDPFYLPSRHWLWSKLKSCFSVIKNNNNPNNLKNNLTKESLSMEDELQLFNSVKAKVIRFEILIKQIFSVFLYPFAIVCSKMGKGDVLQIIAVKES